MQVGRGTQTKPQMQRPGHTGRKALATKKHTLGGVDGLVGGFQFVHWYKPQKYYQYSRNCDLLAVIEPLFQALRATHDDASLLVMSANNDDRDTMRKWDLAQDKSVAFNSVASSAGSTATMAVVVQSAMGHLNGWPSYPFDQEECYARATVAATRSQSLTVILSQIDMMGIIGMIQVLAARAHPIQEVYQATSNWTMPELRAGETQLEQSDREIASWRLNHAGHWQEQTEPPLSIFYLKTKVGGKSADIFFARRPIGSCNLVLLVHHRSMGGEKSVHDSRIGAEPFVHCET